MQHEGHSALWVLAEGTWVGPSCRTRLDPPHQRVTPPDPTGKPPTRPDRTDSGVVPLRVPAISTQPALANACLRRISARGGIGLTPRSVRSDSRRGHPPPFTRLRFAAPAPASALTELLRAASQVVGHELPTRHEPAKQEAHRLVANSDKAQIQLRWQPIRSDARTIVSDAWAALDRWKDLNPTG